MLMHRLELCNLSRVEERFDLLVGALEQGLRLVMLLILGQARIVVNGFQIGGLRHKQRFDLSLLGRTEIKLLGQMCELPVGIKPVMMPPSHGRRSIGIG